MIARTMGNPARPQYQEIIVKRRSPAVIEIGKAYPPNVRQRKGQTENEMNVTAKSHAAT